MKVWMSPTLHPYLLFGNLMWQEHSCLLAYISSWIHLTLSFYFFSVLFVVYSVMPNDLCSFPTMVQTLENSWQTTHNMVHLVENYVAAHWNSSFQSTSLNLVILLAASRISNWLVTSFWCTGFVAWSWSELKREGKGRWLNDIGGVVM